MAAQKGGGQLSTDVTVFQPPESTVRETRPPAGVLTQLALENRYDGVGYRSANPNWKKELADGDMGDPSLLLTYEYERLVHRIIVRPKMPYLDLLHSGGPIRPVGAMDMWQFPRLSLKLVNNTDQTIVVSEVAVRVDTSIIDDDPIPKLDYMTTSLFFFNDGWGPFRNASVRFDVRREEACESGGIDWSVSNFPYHQTLGDFRDTAYVELPEGLDERPLLKLSPSEAKHRKQHPEESSYDQRCYICALGLMRYKTNKGEAREIKFQAPLFRCDAGDMDLGSDIFYNLFLTAGRQKYTLYRSLSRMLKKGDAAQFILMIATDKSARFDLSFSLRGADGVSISADPVELHVLVPRAMDGLSWWRTRSVPPKWHHGTLPTPPRTGTPTS
jgi:hypothetical protein